MRIPLGEECLCEFYSTENLRQAFGRLSESCSRVNLDSDGACWEMKQMVLSSSRMNHEGKAVQRALSLKKRSVCARGSLGDGLRT